MELVQKRSTVQIASQAIIDFLKEGEIKPGEKMPSEIEMCKRLGISRATLREGYRQLETMGYINLVSGRGAFVAEGKNGKVEEVSNYFRLNSGKMRDYLEVRLSFDAQAAKLAAERRTDDEVILLEAYQRDFEAAVVKKDNVLMASLDAKFHEKIVDMAHNELMTALEKLINFYFSQLRQTSFLLDEHANNAIEPHRAILSAIRKGYGKLAAQESMKHMQQSLSDICGC